MSLTSTSNPFVVAQAGPDERVQFIRQTYTHVAGAWLLFFLLECVLIPLPLMQSFTGVILEYPKLWLLVLAAFMGVAWISRVFVTGGMSLPWQYGGLALYVFAEALIFAPFLIFTIMVAGPMLLLNAVLLSAALFAGLTATVFLTRKDFSFLKSALCVAAPVSLGLIASAILFGFNLGLWFSAGMIAVAAAAILYDTSKILHEHKPDEYVAAALELFASMALLLWYVIRILLAFGRKDE